MKLYATTTSERASKGQGGNKRLDIQLTVGNSQQREPAGAISMREIEKDKFSIIYWQKGEGKNLAIIDLQEKAKKQKGEKCKKCGAELNSEAHKTFNCN